MEEALLQKANTADQALAEAKARAEVAQDALAAARSGREGDETLPTVDRRIGETTKAFDALQEKVSDGEKVLSEQRRQEEEQQDVLRAVEAQEKICADLTAEENMLRAEDGAEIRRRVHRLMLDRLVDGGNAHLALLSGRYLLRAAVDDGLGFQVEDSAQQKTHRSVKTLSGGESFLVSLCLALGLSELAANHRRIESLFLDEGFGTLDEETLYRVMAALKGLRSNGKMVGVISHVKRLADEIPTQIRVEKDPGGRSRLQVVA
jgi:DNA repair protein SbcC/Rad50